MRHPLGLAAQGGIHNGLDLFRSISRFAATPRGHFPQPLQTLLLKARPPKHYRLAINIQPRRNLIGGHSFGGGQGDAATVEQPAAASRRRTTTPGVVACQTHSNREIRRFVAQLQDNRSRSNSPVICWTLHLGQKWVLIATLIFLQSL